MPPARRAEELVTRGITALKQWSERHAAADRVTLRVSEVRAVLETLEVARQEVVALNGPPTRDHIPAALRRQVERLAGYRCEGCATDLSAEDADRHIDHIIPVARFGVTRLDNLQLLCGPCNLRKGAAV